MLRHTRSRRNPPPVSCLTGTCRQLVEGQKASKKRRDRPRRNSFSCQLAFPGLRGALLEATLDHGQRIPPNGDNGTFERGENGRKGCETACADTRKSRNPVQYWILQAFRPH